MGLVNGKAAVQQLAATEEAAVARSGAVDARKAEIACAAFLALIAIAAVRASLQVGAGWTAGGPNPGFLPFIVGVAIIGGAVAVAARAVLAGDQGTIFEQQEEIWEVVRVGVPVLVAVMSVYFLGFYMMVALYSAVFVIWYGHHRWYVAVPGALVLTAILYWALEMMFRAFLPKSIFYGDHFWF
jgi:hypothetical protein